MMPSSNTNFTLLAVDTSSIQTYIFGSNRLRENIGASYLVKQATENWAYEALCKVAPSNNLDKQDYKLDEDKQIIKDNLDAEVIYAGGGNLVALFREESQAKDFTRKLSTTVLMKAPGLHLDIYQEKFNWDEQLGEAVSKLLGNMKQARGRKPASAPLLGLGVTVMCQSTAMPAVEIVQDPGGEARYVSAEIAAKLDSIDNANQWLRNELPIGKDYKYPRDLDDMGRSEGATSYIAIVHADGNGVGAMIAKISNTADNRDYIKKMRDFSRQIESISKAAMIQVLVKLQQNVDRDTKKITGSKSVDDLVIKDNYLPIRPIVFGGDDTTFVCDGRVGLALATTYLKAFEEAAKEKELNLSACAGISIVKTHYPFARAYNLAEELCTEAKKFRKEKFPEKGGALDWYFSAGGLYGSLEKMREREYCVNSGSLTLRPVSLGDEGGERAWSKLEQVTRDFENKWGEKRNKVKALRDALRDGPEAVEKFVNTYEQVELPKYDPFTKNGWSDGKCGYFDALELLDIYLPLNKPEDK